MRNFTAFVLGAGLGTRLRPLTNLIPKPLVPILNKPLITFALDHLIHSGAGRFVVNTHHRPEAYGDWMNGQTTYREKPICFRHESLLLETGGGILNAQDLLGDGDFVVYNGDVLADFPLAALIDEHLRSGRIATLALRSSGFEKRIQCDSKKGVVTDMRGLIGNRTEPSFLYTGVSIFKPEIFRFIPREKIISIIPVLVDLIRKGVEVGGCVIDEGVWFDIGTVDAYLDIHSILHAGRHHFSYLPTDALKPVSENAVVHSMARLKGFTSLGERAVVGAGAVVIDSILWPDAVVPDGEVVEQKVILPEIKTARCSKTSAN